MTLGGRASGDWAPAIGNAAAWAARATTAERKGSVVIQYRVVFTDAGSSRPRQLAPLLQLALRETVTLRLSALHIYPIKAARGIPLAESTVDAFGLRYDRRWMVVDESGVFLSQRSHPLLALVVPSIGDGVLLIDAPGMPTLRTPMARKSASPTRFRFSSCRKNRC